MSYSGLQGRVYRMLQSVPWTRERHNKDKAIVKLLTAHGVPTDLVGFIQDANSADRYWRLLTSEHKELRGEDYNTKAIVEQRTQVSLGYEANYHENVKQLELV